MSKQHIQIYRYGAYKQTTIIQYLRIMLIILITLINYIFVRMFSFNNV